MDTIIDFLNVECVCRDALVQRVSFLSQPAHRCDPSEDFWVWPRADPGGGQRAMPPKDAEVASWSTA